MGDGRAELGDRLPGTVLAAVLARPGGRVLGCHAEPIGSGTGAATGAAGAGGRFDRADVEVGYHATLALTGAGRVH
ncbi:hypothetical protein [Nonomuraea sp. KM88]|uniref:hypothetical protein n=1 Tax=Nonomuraea sp. KM88 TaxID=3457427 RepID=UPI003FCDC63E